MSELVYFRGQPIGQVTGWDGDVPIIDFGLPASRSEQHDLAGDQDTPRSRDMAAPSEAPGHPLPPGPRDPARHIAGSVREPVVGRYPAAGIRATSPNGAPSA